MDMANMEKALGKSVSLLRELEKNDIYAYNDIGESNKMQKEVHLNLIKYIFDKVQYKDLLILFGKLNLFVKDDKIIQNKASRLRKDKKIEANSTQKQKCS